MSSESSRLGAPPAAAGKFKVVLVDDSAPARAMLARLLAPYLCIHLADFQPSTSQRS